MNQLDQIASKSLGDSTSYAVYSDKVDASLLNPMPRELARGQHEIMTSEQGCDVWHCYEATYLNRDGVPQAGVLKIIVPHDSKYIIESKSLKLYLNTYDMVAFESHLHYESSIQKDLSRALETQLAVTFFEYSKFRRDTIVQQYDIHETVTSGIKVNSYDGTYNIPRATAVIKGLPVTHSIYMPTLRSRCRHTKQKDSGAVSIIIKTGACVNVSDVMKYVYSLREVNEFHEFCAEKIYTEVKKAYGGLVSVHCFYARRGGIDISPCRYDDFGDNSPVFKEFSHPGVLVKGFDGQ